MALDLASNPATDAAGSVLSRKYAGVPFGFWLVGAGGVAFVVRKLLNGQQKANDATNTTNDSGYVIDANGNSLPSAYTGAAGGVPFGSGSNNSAAGSAIPDPVPAVEITNDAWLRRASEKLSKAGMWDAVYIQQTLNAYIAGKPLDQRQQAVVNQAIKMEGQPPVNVDPGTLAPPAVPAAPNTGPDGTQRIVYFVEEIQSRNGVPREGRTWAKYADGRWVASHTAVETNTLRLLSRRYFNGKNAPIVRLASSDPVIVGLKRTNP